MSPQPDPSSFIHSGDNLEEFLRRFWKRQVRMAEDVPLDLAHSRAIPLMRVKKVMRSNIENNTMLAKESTQLIAKACEIMIAEMTARAFLVADSHKRRTLSRTDIAKALSETDQFDFLLDIVPRDNQTGSTNQRIARSTPDGRSASALVEEDSYVYNTENNLENNLIDPWNFPQDTFRRESVDQVYP